MICLDYGSKYRMFASFHAFSHRSSLGAMEEGRLNEAIYYQKAAAHDYESMCYCRDQLIEGLKSLS